MNARLFVLVLCATSCFFGGCRKKYRDDLDYSHRVIQTWTLDDLLFDGEIVQFESVFWEPDDTVSLRAMIVDDGIASGRDVMEIGTGTGLLSILCAQHDAGSVLATDINPAALDCAKYNAAMLTQGQEIDFRLVLKSDAGAFSALGKTEKFDLIISNPPWEDGVVAKPADHAFYDPGFALMDSLLDGLPERLNPGGRCLVAYGHVPAIERLLSESEKRGIQTKILDERSLDELSKDFLPGMVIELRPPVDRKVVAGDQFIERGSFEPSSSDDAGEVASPKDESPKNDSPKDESPKDELSAQEDDKDGPSKNP